MDLTSAFLAFFSLTTYKPPGMAPGEWTPLHRLILREEWETGLLGEPLKSNRGGALHTKEPLEEKDKETPTQGP